MPGGPGSRVRLSEEQTSRLDLDLTRAPDGDQR